MTFFIRILGKKTTRVAFDFLRGYAPTPLSVGRLHRIGVYLADMHTDTWTAPQILTGWQESRCIGYMGQLILTKNSYRVVSRFTEPQFYREIMFVVRSIEKASPAAARFIEFFKNYLAQDNRL